MGCRYLYIKRKKITSVDKKKSDNDNKNIFVMYQTNSAFKAVTRHSLKTYEWHFAKSTL